MKAKRFVSLLVILFVSLCFFIGNILNLHADEDTVIKIEGKKYVMGAFVTPETFTFVLERCDPNGIVYDSAAPEYYYDTTTTTGADDFSFTIVGLADGIYYYRITEQKDSAAYWIYAEDEYIIEVTVENGNAYVSYPGADRLAWEAPGTNGNPLGSANYFGGLSFGDWVGGPDHDSGLAVGGNLSSILRTGEYHIGHPWTPGVTVAPHNPRLLVKGNVITDVPFAVVGGTTVFSESSQLMGTRQLSTYRYIGSYGVYNSLSTSPYYAPLTATHFEQIADYIRVSDTAVANFFNDAKTDLQNLSQYYNNLTPSARVAVIDIAPVAPWSTAYTIVDFDDSFPADYNNYDYIVYNLTINNTEPLDTSSDLYFNIPEDYNGLIVINVLPGYATNTLQIAGNAWVENASGSMGYNGKNWEFFDYNHQKASELSDKLIWNFPISSVTEITPNSMVVMGSVLAPYSAYNPKGSAGSVNGTLIAQSVLAIEGWEVHVVTNYGKVSGESDEIIFINTYDETLTTEEPTTTTEEPTTTTEEPTTTIEEPTTTIEEPTTTIEEPITTTEEESTTITTTEEESTTITTTEEESTTITTTEEESTTITTTEEESTTITTTEEESTTITTTEEESTTITTTEEVLVEESVDAGPAPTAPAEPTTQPKTTELTTTTSATEPTTTKAATEPTTTEATTTETTTELTTTESETEPHVERLILLDTEPVRGVVEPTIATTNPTTETTETTETTTELTTSEPTTETVTETTTAEPSTELSSKPTTDHSIESTTSTTMTTIPAAEAATAPLTEPSIEPLSEISEILTDRPAPLRQKAEELEELEEFLPFAHPEPTIEAFEAFPEAEAILLNPSTGDGLYAIFGLLFLLAAAAVIKIYRL